MNVVTLVLRILAILAWLAAAASARTGRLNCIGLGLALWGIAYLLDDAHPEVD